MPKDKTAEKSIEINPGDTFDTGTRVKRGGLYICAPCGDTKRFKRNQTFPRCFSCMEGKTYNEDKYVKDLGLWEFIEG